MSETTIQNDKYVHFPLCCLHFNKNMAVTADYLISYGIIERAKKLHNSTDNTAIDAACEDTLGIIPGDFQQTRERAAAIQQHIDNFENKYGRDAQVRIHKSVLFDVRDKKFKYGADGFRVLCAIYSKISRRFPFPRITTAEINVRARGIRSAKLMDEFVEMDSLPPLLSRDKINRTVKKLDGEFIATFTYKKREKRFTRDKRKRKELIDYSAAIHAKKQSRKDQQAKDQAYFAERMSDKLGYEWTEKQATIVPLVDEQIENVLSVLHGDIANG